ncbi:MAG: sugar phosphate isomerase/epimerase family protein [bacterium]
MSTNIPPISVQLYTLRDACQEDFDGVLSQLADIGYAGVEPFSLFGRTPEEFCRQVKDLGMQVSSSHFPWINRTDNLNEVVETIQALGLTRAPGGFAPDDFKDRASLEQTIATTASLVELLKPHGLTLFLHNHYWEYELLDGQPAYHYLQDAVPDVEFEIDTYWAANFGQRDPAAEITRVNKRVPLMHVKDGPLVKGQSHVAVGDGAMDIAALFAAADPDTLEWAVVELDQCDTDMMAAVKQSYTYLTSNKLAQGNV